MKKTLTISEARELFMLDTFATGEGFVICDKGKYGSGLTFVVESSVELDKDGKAISPINDFIEAREISDSFNLDLCDTPKILFGDFWYSKKSGGPCFRPKNPARAKHILVRVIFSHSYERYHGNAMDDGALYFRCAASNGGRSGFEYWILPVGYVHKFGTNTYSIDTGLAQAYCAKYAHLQAAQSAENDRLYREKMAAEAKSQKDKELFAPRLMEIAKEFDALKDIGIMAPSITLNEKDFKVNCEGYLYIQSYLYTEENLQKIESKRRFYVGELAPKFRPLLDQAKAANLHLSIDSQSVELTTPPLNGSYKVLLQERLQEVKLQHFEEKIREMAATTMA